MQGRRRAKPPALRERQDEVGREPHFAQRHQQQRKQQRSLRKYQPRVPVASDEGGLLQGECRGRAGHRAQQLRDGVRDSARVRQHQPPASDGKGVREQPLSRRRSEICQRTKEVSHLLRNVIGGRGKWGRR